MTFERTCANCIHFSSNACRAHPPSSDGFPYVADYDVCGGHELDLRQVEAPVWSYGMDLSRSGPAQIGRIEVVEDGQLQVDFYMRRPEGSPYAQNPVSFAMPFHLLSGRVSRQLAHLLAACGLGPHFSQVGKLRWRSGQLTTWRNGFEFLALDRMLPTAPPPMEVPVNG